MSSEVQLPFGQDIATGRMVAVADVANGAACACICPKCKRPLVAKQGNLKQWHFAHESDADCGGALETARHKMAKQIICDAASLHVPIYSEIYGFLSGGNPIAFTTPATEVWFDGMRADVAAEWEGEPLMIEVAVTHYCGADKIALIEARRIRCLEINLAPYFHAPGDTQFADAVLRLAPRRWLYHPEVERLRIAAAEREEKARREAEEMKRAEAERWKIERERQRLYLARLEEERQRQQASVREEEEQFIQRWQLQYDREREKELPAKPSRFSIPVEAYIRVALMRPPHWFGGTDAAPPPGVSCTRCEGTTWRQTVNGWACRCVPVVPS